MASFNQNPSNQSLSLNIATTATLNSEGVATVVFSNYSYDVVMAGSYVLSLTPQISPVRKPDWRRPERRSSQDE